MERPVPARLFAAAHPPRLHTCATATVIPHCRKTTLLKALAGLLRDKRNTEGLQVRGSTQLL